MDGMNPTPKVRVHHLQQAKDKGEPISMLTAYDALVSPIFEAAGIDILLVGDSLGNVVLGYNSTIPVSLEDMERATGAVARSVTRPLIVADLPFGSYEAGPREAFEASVRLMKAGAQAVKLEGGTVRSELVEFLVDNGIPVMGHLGYTPQAEHALGGPRLQGRGDSAAVLMEDAAAIQEAGAFAVVLEMVPGALAAELTDRLSIPTIGIGAGPHCDGQVLVWTDMAGMTDWSPRFARRFGELGAGLLAASKEYIAAVHDGSFPGPQETREA